MQTQGTESLLAQWFRRVWNEGDMTALEELTSADVLSHGLAQTITGIYAWRKSFYEPMQAALGGVKVEVLEEYTVGDKIFARLEAHMVPKRTGQPVTMLGMNMMRIADGKIVESWDSWDFLGAIESMKLMPPGSFGLAITGGLIQHPMA